MEHDQDQETPCFIPVIARLDRLDSLVQLLEDRRSPRSEFHAAEGKNERCTLSSALEQVQHKGTLMERLTMLEKRVLELSLEIDERNTSRSSSSTIDQGSVMIGKKDSEMKDENGDGVANEITKQQMEDLSTIQAQGRASPADGIVEEKAVSHKGRRQKKKSQKWSWLFRHTC